MTQKSPDAPLLFCTPFVAPPLTNEVRGRPRGWMLSEQGALLFDALRSESSSTITAIANAADVERTRLTKAISQKAGIPYAALSRSMALVSPLAVPSLDGPRQQAELFQQLSMTWALPHVVELWKHFVIPEAKLPAQVDVGLDELVITARVKDLNAVLQWLDALIPLDWFHAGSESHGSVAPIALAPLETPIGTVDVLVSRARMNDFGMRKRSMKYKHVVRVHLDGPNGPMLSGPT